jgi:hypothetical protein
LRHVHSLLLQKPKSLSRAFQQPVRFVFLLTSGGTRGSVCLWWSEGRQGENSSEIEVEGGPR